MPMTKKCLAIVPARGGSRRIKDKNILDFSGKPMMSYILEAARDSGIFSEIHVSTDSARIARVAARLGFPVEFMRGPGLSGDRAPLMAVLRWTLEEYARRGRVFAEVGLLTATAPLVEARDLVCAYRLFRRHGSRHQVIATSPLPVPMEWALDRDAAGWISFRTPGAASIRSQELRRAYFDTGLFAFFDAREILRPPSRPRRVLSTVLPRDKAVDIDEPEDLELARVLFHGRRGGA